MTIGGFGPLRVSSRFTVRGPLASNPSWRTTVPVGSAAAQNGAQEISKIKLSIFLGFTHTAPQRYSSRAVCLLAYPIFRSYSPKSYLAVLILAPFRGLSPFSGDSRHGNRYCEVVQRFQGLWFHHPGSRR